VGLDCVLGRVPDAGEQHRYAQVMLTAVMHVGGELGRNWKFAVVEAVRELVPV
jgi:uncharacterized NAD-dependent epimerase/dehydratase family protein